MVRLEEAPAKREASIPLKRAMNKAIFFVTADLGSGISGESKHQITKPILVFSDDCKRVNGLELAETRLF